MALPELLRTLETEAEGRITALLAEARTEAGQITADAAAALARRRDADLAAREAILRARARRAIEAARSASAARLLEARAAALERVRLRAAALLAGRAADPALADGFARDVERALDYLGGAPAVIEAPGPLLPALGARLGGRGDVTLTPAADPAALRVRSRDGTVTIDATLAGRLARAWPRLAIALAPQLEASP